MTKRQVTYGKCFSCGEAFAKNAITRHLGKCPARQEAIVKESGKPAQLFHLLVEGRYETGYWMHIEFPASRTLADLDDFLRAVWLECCGHLSAFTIGNTRFEMDTGMIDAMWKGFFGPSQPVKSMQTKLYSALAVGDKFLHEYDFGTTTALKLKVVGERKGAPPPKGARILARNYAPVYPCVKCGKPAKLLYVYDYPFDSYCKEHARQHASWEEGFMPIVNSPRTGECGYSGPHDKTLAFEETYTGS
ncbi:MAG: hypothetical protein ACOYYJ_17135 [Chloroflexota bacterium]